jgi:hypothetical protein
MAKKAKKQNKKAPVNELPENMLPQNILPMGREAVFILISIIYPRNKKVDKNNRLGKLISGY